MTKYVVIDTNILVSTLIKYDSIPGKIIEYVAHGFLIPILNKQIFKEYKEVLSRDKFNFNIHSVEFIISLFNDNGIFINEKESNIEFIDKSDKAFYDVLISSKDEYDTLLITGNIKHFPKDERVLTPREFIDCLSAE